MLISREQLADLAERILTRHGVPAEHARIQAATSASPGTPLRYGSTTSL